MIFTYDAVGYPVMNASGLWWAQNGNYLMFGIAAIVMTICFFVLRRKE